MGIRIPSVEGVRPDMTLFNLPIHSNQHNPPMVSVLPVFLFFSSLILKSVSLHTRHQFSRYRSSSTPTLLPHLFPVENEPSLSRQYSETADVSSFSAQGGQRFQFLLWEALVRLRQVCGFIWSLTGSHVALFGYNSAQILLSNKNKESNGDADCLWKVALILQHNK